MNKFRHHFPFSLGCTSYQIPADILPNVVLMAPLVDDIEIVLFESQEYSNVPDCKTVLELGSIAHQEKITYSIHLPIDKNIGTASTADRDRFIEQIAAIASSVAPLPVSGYVLHMEGFRQVGSSSGEGASTGLFDDFCSQLIAQSGIPALKFCIENLDYPPENHRELVDRFAFSHCIDVGHLWRYGQAWENYLTKTLPKARIIHLHGVTGRGEDHRSLRHHRSVDELKRLLWLLRAFTGVLTLEVFNKSDFDESVTLIGELWQTLPL